MKKRLYIVDDHPIIRLGLKLALTSQLRDVEWVGGSGTVGQALKDISCHKPDIILLDLALKDGDGTEIVEAFKRTDLIDRFLILTQEISPETKAELLRQGVSDVVLKSTEESDLVKIVANKLELAYGTEVIPSSIDRTILTNRELQIAELVVMGMTNNESAQKLGCSAETIKSHKSSIFRKTGSKNSVELVSWMLKST